LSGGAAQGDRGGAKGADGRSQERRGDDRQHEATAWPHLPVTHRTKEENAHNNLQNKFKI
jgi:hypothetical protein